MDSNTKELISKHLKLIIKYKDFNNNLIDIRDTIKISYIESFNKKDELINYCDILLEYISNELKKEINNFNLP